MGKSIAPHHSEDSPDDAGRVCPLNRAYSHEGVRGDTARTHPATDGQMFPLSPDLLPDYERAQHHERNPNQIGEHLNEAVITDLRLLGNTTNGSRTEDNSEVLAQQGSANRTFQVPQTRPLGEMTEVRRQNSIDLSREIDIQSNVVRQGPSRVGDTLTQYPRINETYPRDEIHDHRADRVFSEHVISSTSYNAPRSHSLGDMDALQRHTGGITHSQSITEGTLRERPSRLSLPNGHVGVDNGSVSGMVRSDTFATEHNHFELAYMMPQAENNETGLIGCELLLRFLHSLMIREHIPEPNCILPIRSPVQDNYTIILQHGERLRLLADDFSRSPQRQLVRERAAEVVLGSLDMNSFSCIVLSTFENGVTSERVVALFFFCSDLALRALRDNWRDLFHRLVQWTQVYIMSTLSVWVQKHGGWSEVDLPIKLEESLKGEVHDNEEPDCCLGPITDPPTKEELNDYQEPECCVSPKTFPPIKEELHDESDATYYVDKNVKTEMKVYDPSQELMVCTPYFHTPENKAQIMLEQEQSTSPMKILEKKTKCKSKNCTKYDQSGEYCVAHEKGRKCKSENCIKYAQSRGYCNGHGGGRKCKSENCTKNALSGGYCNGHGGGKKCNLENCAKLSKLGGYCTRHGGTRKCKSENCIKHAFTGGYCFAHGGVKKCNTENCTNRAYKRGYCKLHGAIAKCKSENCTNLVQLGGYCRRHGGGKKCKSENCTKLVFSGGYCWTHRDVLKCKSEFCTKNAQSGGYCNGHGGGKRCKLEKCNKLAKLGGYCITHGGEKCKS